MAKAKAFDYEYLIQEDRVHGMCYTNPDIFEDEMEHIYHTEWVYVGHIGEVPEPGDYRTVKIGKQPVIIARGEDGQVRVLMNRCRHRGATVCQAEKGNANFFRCAYHGWTYKNNGELIGVPFPRGYGEQFAKEAFGLPEVPRMGEYRGFIFASLCSTGITFEEYLPETVRKYMDLYINLSPLGELDMRRGVLKTYVKANWKHQLENGSGDGYHPYFAHENWMNLIKERLGGDLKRMGSWRDGGPDSGERQRYLGGPAHFTVDYLEKRRQRALREGLKIPTETEQSVLAVKPLSGVENTRAHEVFPEVTENDLSAYLSAMEAAYGKEQAHNILISGGPHMNIWPNLQITPLSIRVIRPISVNETEIDVYIPWYKGAPDSFNLQRVRGAEGFFGMSAWGGQDDYEMFERIQQGLEAEVEPWNYLGRGLNRQGVDSDGLWHAGITDELCIRRIWAYWKEVMVSAQNEAGKNQEKEGVEV